MLPRQREVEGGPERVNVAAPVGAPGVLLDGGIPGRSRLPDDRRRGLPGHEELDEPEVDQHGVALRGDADVVGLNVAVNDGRGLSVQVGQGVQNLLHPPHGVGLGDDALMRHVVGEREPGDVVHHQVLPPLIRREDVGDAGQVRVLQARQKFRLLEKLPGIGGVEVLLERHVTVLEAQIARQVDGAHPPLPQKGEDLVAPLQHPVNVHRSSFSWRSADARCRRR